VIERGQVIAVAASGIDVRMHDGETAACKDCGHCSRVDKEGLVICDVRDDFGVFVGDDVEVEISDEADVRAGIVVYILPVATLLLGYGIGRFIGSQMGWNPDMTGAVVAVMGVVAGMLLMRTRVRKLFVSDRFRPKVRAIITRGSAPADHRPGDTT
jgi:positive regulator of sigma E activity